MKKIDTWLSIQRYVSEAAHAPLNPTISNVEIWGRARKSDRRARAARRLTVTRIATI